PDITVSCTYDYDPDNLSNFFGEVVVDFDDRDSIIIDDPDFPGVPPFRGLDGYVIDNCGVTVTSTRRITINQCGEGNIRRTFRATDPNGSATCLQRIFFENPNPFNESGIVWPTDYEVNSGICDAGDLDPATLPTRFGFPQITEDECDLVGIAYDDHVFPFGSSGDNSCFKIIRKWKVIDWCGAYTDPNTGGTVHPTWEHQQILKVLNDVAPEFTSGCEPVNVISVDPDCDNAEVVLMATATDDCTSDLVYSYQIDAFNDGDFNISGQGNDATGDYPVGTHRILWTVEDQCGNTTSCESTFMIENSKLPTPYCYNGLSITIMPATGMIDIWAVDFDAGSFHSCGLDVTVAFSPDVNDTQRIFTCDDLGMQTIQMYAIDANGNYDFCTTFIDVQDNSNVCGPNPLRAQVSGRILTEDTENVAFVDVSMEGSGMDAVATNDEGVFAFPQMLLGGNYVVNPEKDMNYMNGISTYDLVLIQKHLLGVDRLTSPYRIIAADINKSNHVSTLDLVELRKLILGVYDELPSNDSWRFVDAAYEFEDPFNPFAEAFPEQYTIETLNEDMNIDFVGVKIGDVNGTVTPNIRSGNQLNFVLENQSYNTGDKVKVDFTAEDMEALTGYQFTLKFDHHALAFNQIIPGSLDIDANNFGTKYAERGLIVTSWNNALGRDINVIEVLFSIEFNAKEQGTLNNVLNVSSQVLNAEAYGDDNSIMDVALNFRTEIANNDFALFQNSPNPFNNETMISFNLPEASLATLSIYDATGRLLKMIEGEYNKGFHEVMIGQNDVDAKGVLYYRLDTEKYSATRKMIIMK
ncbi:MAG: T9SS type A sorting domain-containing protein, partial [Bacteroidota bacterium]